MLSWSATAVKRSCKGWLKRLHLAYIRKRFAFTPQDLLSLLRRLGVQTGDVLFVHSAFDQFEGFLGKPTDVILTLQEAVGTSGTLLMPTLSFTGSAVQYVEQGSVFDVKRTPSRMGLLTELFRRAPGVLRSVHPTHAVAAWGARAAEMVADHYLAETPCGRQTPYGRLLDYQGKIVFLGTGIRVMTFFHTVEELLEPEMPFSPFTNETFSLCSRTTDGQSVMTHMRLFDPTHSRRRRLNALIPVLQQGGQWHEGTVGKLPVILLRAQDILETAQTLAKKGVYCYES
jgi:aminoglycoside 3-N-acetyltransferase